MNSILNNRKLQSFDWWYFFIIVIYMAQATPETSRMVGNLSGFPIPFLIPLILTFLVYKRYNVNLNDKRLLWVTGAYMLWATCSILKYGNYSSKELSFYFFPLYIIIVSYIQVKAYGKRMLILYEEIMVLFCKIATIAWLVALIPSSHTIFQMFPETGFGNNVLYLFNCMDPHKGQVSLGIIRNAGCSWEPGRFSIMVTLAMYCNLSKYGIKFRNNKNIWWLLAALISTQSTTGYAVAIILYTVFSISRINIRSFLSLCIIIPLTYIILSLNFMWEKTNLRLNDALDVSQHDQVFAWHSTHTEEGEYLGSIDRFEALVFEWENFIHDPILGYSHNNEHSFFYTNISSNFRLANGFVRIIAEFGILFGGLIFFMLYRSSFFLAKNSNCKKRFALMFTLLASALSYTVFTIPLFTAFWMYGMFAPEDEFS